jgi:hypothetical protein
LMMKAAPLLILPSALCLFTFAFLYLARLGGRNAARRVSPEALLKPLTP